MLQDFRKVADNIYWVVTILSEHGQETEVNISESDSQEILSIKTKTIE